MVSLQPANAVAHNNLGLTLKAQGRPAEAEVEYLAALQNNPKYPEALNNLGLLYEQQGRVQEAIQQYRKAIEISPDYPEAHLNYAQVLERAGYPEEARRHYQSFLAADSAVSSSLRLRVQQPWIACINLKSSGTQFMLVLGIETSCDETAAAVVEDGQKLRSSVLFSQVDLHYPYGGVVPELASRRHIEVVDEVVESALSKAGCRLEDLDAVSVTCGPGLVGALLVGISFAKALAYGLKIPLLAVNHAEGHIASVFLNPPK